MNERVKNPQNDHQEQQEGSEKVFHYFPSVGSYEGSLMQGLCQGREPLFEGFFDGEMDRTASEFRQLLLFSCSCSERSGSIF